jgi:hypothetical protein
MRNQAMQNAAKPNRPVPIFNVNNRSQMDQLGLSSYDRIRLPPDYPSRI